jgi:hypothetical protein
MYSWTGNRFFPSKAISGIYPASCLMDNVSLGRDSGGSLIMCGKLEKNRFILYPF